MKNDKIKLTIGVAMATGIVAHTLVDSIKTHRQEKAKREQIKLDQELDLEAIRYAGDRVSEELRSGEYDHLSLGEMLHMLNNRIAFERIVVRLKQD